MSILDQKKLIESIHPFELLSSTELDNLMGKIDIAYYSKDTLLISPTLNSIVFYIIIKGSVKELIDDEIHNVFNEGDSFDADALIYSKTKGKFIVDEDLICYEIKKDDFLDLMQNKDIQSYFLQDLVSRNQSLKNYDMQSDLSGFLIARIKDIFLHEVCIVEPTVSIYDALKEQQKIKAKVILVKDNNHYSIVTDTDIRTKMLLNTKINIYDNIFKIATQNIITIDINDFLFNALLSMTENEIKRLVVTDGDKVVGILEQLDLLSYFANHSHLVSVQIDKANTIDDLKNVQSDLRNLIITLRAKGVKVRYITKLVSTLNIKIYKKVFDMCVDERYHDKCALLVMGSEGREEQTLKTDQDNALIIKDSSTCSELEDSMKVFNDNLLSLGFPTCKGNVMVTNKFWSKELHDYKNSIDAWTHDISDENAQNLSIFLDAKFVTGDISLFNEVNTYMYNQFSQRDDVLAHIAKAILNFDTPISMFSNFILAKDHNNSIDIKKGGIFAIVHGIRTLCLQYEIKETNTIERIKELNNKGIFDKTFATELIESFDTLCAIRLKAMLDAKSLDESNYISPNDLQKIQRDLLKDSFRIVNKFKKFINFHFHLNMVS